MVSLTLVLLSRGLEPICHFGDFVQRAAVLPNQILISDLSSWWPTRFGRMNVCSCGSMSVQVVPTYI